MAKINRYRNKIMNLLVTSTLLACILSMFFSYLYARRSVVLELEQEEQNMALSIMEMEQKTDLSIDEIVQLAENQSLAISIIPFQQLNLPASAMSQLMQEKTLHYKSSKRDIPSTYVMVGNSSAVKISAPLPYSVYLSAFSRILSTLFFFLVVSFFVSWCFAFKIAHPISQIRQAFSLIQKGDYSVRVPENEAGELGNLMHSFNQMAETLSKTAYLQKDFISSISHEFKTPIASIHGFAKLIKMDSVDSTKKDEYIDIIEQESERLSRLSVSLLRLAALEQQTSPPQYTEFYIDEQIRQVILRMETTWSEKDISWNMNMDSVRIVSDADLLTEVWLNLLQNAIKFSPEHSEITVTVATSDKNVKVSIADKGIGMDEKTIERIFDRFYQGDTSRNKEGAGLGLSLVKRILDILSGNISVASLPGKGSTFTVTLPLKGETDK